jgi:alpha-glucosidase (family GH31 glycosyl hydrolase)
MDKYIQFDMILPSQNIFGFGDRKHEFKLGEGTYTMWASNMYNGYDDLSGRKGTTGVHPFILVQSGKTKGEFFGIFFRNANAQSPILKYGKGTNTTLSYITTGGDLEIYFFM